MPFVVRSVFHRTFGRRKVKSSVPTSCQLRSTPGRGYYGVHRSSLQSPIRVFDAQVSLEQTAQLEGSEVNVPDSIVDLFEADVFANADGRDVHPAVVPPDAAIRADVADFEAIGIFQRRELGRHLPDRGRVAGRRRLLIESLVRTLVIELLSKAVEATLLGSEAARRGAGRRGFQSAMHPFMPPVLVGAAGLDELREGAEAHPPRRELGEPGQGGGGKGHAIVGADPRGQVSAAV